MRFWVTLEDHDAEVDFQTDGEHVWLEVEGRRLEADFRRLPDGEVYSLLIEGRSYEVRVTPAAGGVQVAVGGNVFPVEVRHPLEKLLQSVRPAAASMDGETIAAPMPGLVVAIKVRIGDRVEKGASVAVVEAMKMQNELVAQRGGVVSEVLVGDRVSVTTGQPLVRLKAESP